MPTPVTRDKLIRTATPRIYKRSAVVVCDRTGWQIERREVAHPA